MTRPDIALAISNGLLARNGQRVGGAEINFRCFESARHAHGDRDPSALANVEKLCWRCPVCGARGGWRDLARRLGIAADGADRRGRGRRTTYAVRDVDGSLVAEHIRDETAAGKKMWWRGTGCTYGLGGQRVVTLPLYRSETLRELAPGSTVVLVEGEKAADALAARGIAALGTVTGAAVIPVDEVLKVLLGREMDGVIEALPVVDVVLWPDADRVGREHMQRIAARLVRLRGRARWFDPFPDATDGRDAADDERDGEQLRAAIAEAPAWQAADEVEDGDHDRATEDVPLGAHEDHQDGDASLGASEAPPDSGPTGERTTSPRDPKVSQATLLLELADDFDLFHAPDADPVAYCRVQIDEHHETYPIPSRPVRALLRRRFYLTHRKSVRGEALKEALATLEARALIEGEAHAVYTRIAEHDGAIYIDLCDPEWRVVEVSTAGWRIVTDAPVVFRRARGMLPLPEPVRGGRVDDLRRFLNVADHHDAWRLVVGWLLAALRPRGPYPVIALHGEQGAAKSTATRVLRELVDPNVAGLRAEPREPRDLVIAASNGWIVAMDNLSRISTWLSDALCRLSTGGGFGTRELFTDGEEVLFSAMRPVAVNGIEGVCVRGDLADRAVMVTLPAVPEEQRQTETDFWRTFDEARPAILGALLDVVVGGLRDLPHVHLDRVPRMADFAVWVTACEPALGWESGAFLRSYAGARREANASILESSAVATALIGFMADRQEWTGIAGELLKALSEMVAEHVRRDRQWPQSPRGLTGELRRLAPALRAAGLHYEPPTRVGRERRRQLVVRRSEGNDRPHRPHGPQPPSDKDFSADDADDGGRSLKQPSARSSAENPRVSKPAGDAGDADDADDLFPASDGWGDL